MKETSNFNVGVQKVVGKLIKEFRDYPLFCCWVSYIPFVVVTKAKPVEELFTGTKTLKKGWTYRFLHPWLGTGLLTSGGSKWRSRRKLLTPSFHFDILKEFLPVFNEQSEKLVEKLQNETKNNFTDISVFVTVCTLDIICETTLGVKINAQENMNSEYVKAVSRTSKMVAERMINFWYWPDFLFYLTPAGKQHYKDINILHDFTRSIIRDKKQKLLCGGPTEFSTKKRKALMDVLLEHHLKTKDLNEEDIREEVDTFTFEGHDTTSTGISWALYLIGLHKDVQETLHQEIYRIFGEDKDRPVTKDDINDMRYLDRVLKESQRLYPSVPILAREATEKITISGYKIPTGAICAVSTYYLHRDEDVFPDPEKFDPDRFLPENSVNRNPFAYVPFSAGPRNCIGQKFAVMEEKVIVSNILRNFTLESLNSRDEVIPVPELILRSLKPLRIKFRTK